jgi:hypothetical protein
MTGQGLRFLAENGRAGILTEITPHLGRNLLHRSQNEGAADPSLDISFNLKEGAPPRPVSR